VDESALAIQDRFSTGCTFSEVLARPKNNAELWEAINRRASIDAESIERAARLGAARQLLVISEDWCGDCINVLPYLSRLEEAADAIDLRVIGRDTNRDLMDAHLTGASRSIPVAIIYDENFTELGWWGPRPGPLQEWVVGEGLALPKPERYPLIRAWYARDRGRTIVSEVLSIMERGDG